MNVATPVSKDEQQSTCTFAQLDPSKSSKIFQELFHFPVVVSYFLKYLVQDCNWKLKARITFPYNGKSNWANRLVFL